MAVGLQSNWLHGVADGDLNLHAVTCIEIARRWLSIWMPNQP